MRESTPSKQTQFRLPQWATEYLEQASLQRGTSKTRVVLDALRCLQEHELEELMAEGYELAGRDMTAPEELAADRERDEERQARW